MSWRDYCEETEAVSVAEGSAVNPAFSSLCSLLCRRCGTISHPVASPGSVGVHLLNTCSYVLYSSCVFEHLSSPFHHKPFEGRGLV